MRRLLNATTVILAAVAVGTLMPDLGHAQNPQHVPMPPGGFKPPPAAPVKPYKPIAITPPAPYADQSFVAFRKQLTEIAQHKDRAALAKLVVPQGFFWMQDKDLADKRKPAIANLAAAINLDAKDDFRLGGHRRLRQRSDRFAIARPAGRDVCAGRSDD